jgi:D-tyrosyl-tRNA(Tyr) deacylase
MRAVVQRVTGASVRIPGEVLSTIGAGLVVLAAVELGDSGEDVRSLSAKILHLRIFPDAEGVMNLSVLQSKGDILLVSQFTLLASVKKGNRPSYSRCEPKDTARPLFEALASRLASDLGKPVAEGKFGADMQVQLVNDGPVTMLLDTRLPE